MIKIAFHADNDVKSASVAVNAAMVNENADLYCFVGDGPYSSSGTGWVSQQKKHFEDKKNKMLWSRGNHDTDSSESWKTQDDMEAWFPEAKSTVGTRTWCNSRQVGNVYVISMDTEDTDVEFKRDQYNWVAKELEKAKQLRASGQIDWIVMMCHKPWFTLKTNHSPYTAVRFLYKDLLRDAQVDFMIHGHNHNTQLWKPMIPNQSQANGEGSTLFTMMPDGKTFDFSKDHGTAYIVTGHSGHQWNTINDSGAGVQNVLYYADGVKGLKEFGYTLIEFDGKKAKVLAKGSSGKVGFEYNVSREGAVTPPPPTGCPSGQCKDQTTGQCRPLASNETIDANGFCKTVITPPPPTETGVDQAKAMNFIKNSYKAEVQMLEEAPGFNKFWLWNDQLLGNIILKHIDPAMAQTIENKMNSYGVLMRTPLATLDPKYRANFSVKSSSEPTISVNPSIRYSHYGGTSDLSFNSFADIAFLSAIHYYYLGNMTLARQAYEAGKSMWDGQGMKDNGNITGEYATYKVALGLLAEKITGFPSIGIPLDYFKPFQASNGGITTDKTGGVPQGSQNIETTALVLLALNPSLLQDPNPNPPPDNPIAKLSAPSQVAVGQKVVLDASGSSGYDTLEITQTLGEAVQLSSVGTNKKEFIAPMSSETNFKLSFRAIAQKGSKQSVADVSIQTFTVPPPPTCKEGEHWDETLQKCVPNTPPPTGAGKVVPISIAASGQDLGQEASKAIDGNMDTWWAFSGDGAWIEFKFDKPYNFKKIKLTGYNPTRSYFFEINGKQFEIPAGRPANTLAEIDISSLNINSDKLRIIGHGNNTNAHNSIREIEFYTESGDVKHCPPKWHWDETLKKCIPDLEPSIDPTPPPTNKPPIANAGSDITVTPNTIVQLDGSKSSDPDGDPITCQWTQISGKQVKIDNSNKVVATFTAPTLTTTPEDPIAKLILPSTASKGQKNIRADASTSTADDVQITETTSEGIIMRDVGKWIKEFDIPDKDNFSIGIQAKAMKGTKQSVIQRAIQVSNTNPPPPPDGFGTDQFGMKMLFKPTGKKVPMEHGTEHENGKRYNVNHEFHNYIMQGYFKLGKGQEKINHKGDGPNHGGCTDKKICAWYELDYVLATGKGELQLENPHPTNHDIPDSDCEFVKTLDKAKEGQWIGWATAYFWGPDGKRHIRSYVDLKPFADIMTGEGKPLNNWQELVFAIEKGQIFKGITHPRNMQEVIDHEAGLESEIRMHRATQKDTKMNNVFVFEIDPKAVAANNNIVNNNIMADNTVAAAIPEELVFQLRITDSKGVSSTDVVKVTVSNSTPPPTENPVAKLIAPSNILGGTNVLLDGSQSVADTFTITQTAGQTVNLADAGIFKKQFIAPNGNYSLGFEGRAVKGTKQAITQVAMQVSTNLPPPIDGQVLFDSNIHMKVTSEQKVVGKFGNQSPDGKGFFTAASGSPRAYLYPNGEVKIEADKGHGRIYILVLNFNCRLEFDLKFNDLNIDNASFKLNSRHGEGGDGENRYGGYGGHISLKENVAGLKSEKFHNEHDSGVEKQLPKKLEVGKYARIALEIRNDVAGKKKSAKMFVDYKDGQGFVEVVSQTLSNVPAYYIDEAKFKQQSYLWLRVNNEKTGSVTFRDIKVIQL